MYKKKLFISSIALVLSLILTSGIVYAWFAISSGNGKINQTKIEIQNGFGATMRFLVYNHNESFLSSGSPLDLQYIGDANEYYETNSVSVVIAPEIPAYFLLILEGDSVTAETTLRMDFLGIELISYNEDGTYDENILDSFKLEFWDGVTETNSVEYSGVYNAEQKSFIVSGIQLYQIQDNKSYMFFKYILKDYNNQSATKITMEKIQFSVYNA
jgi:hypothetical protein